MTLTKNEQQIKEAIIGKLKRYYGRTVEEATKEQLYNAVAMTVRDTIMDKWTQYRHNQHQAKGKELYYLSFEFLMGRSLANNLLNMTITREYENVCKDLGLELASIEEQETDAGLGNGGLGRLAACFMDSLTTLNLPAFGCSIRYEYGLFKQKIVDGYQVEMPDVWLDTGNVWEIARPEDQQIVRFGGKVHEYYDGDGKMKVGYEDAVTVIGIPYDMPVAGYDADTVNALRLWSAHSPTEMDMKLFSGGDYLKAIEQKALTEVLSKVLYPEDNHVEGKALRLRQQYFFVSCTMQWILKRYKKYHTDLSKLPERVVIHINDTHPAIAIAELMRLLMDEEGMGWDEAYGIVSRVFAYTNHTIMSEALEKWPQDLFERLLPRLWQILDEMNRRQVAFLRERYGDDWGKINYMSIIANGYINMANLCLWACFKVNGVSALHGEIIKHDVFRDYYNLFPEKFLSITNGITYRRWLKLSNPGLADLITSAIGPDWITESQELKSLESFAKDPSFQEKFLSVKQENKKRLAAYIQETTGITVDVNSIFDVQVKRLHEYKRQLLNVLRILYLYDKIKNNQLSEIQPRTFLFGAKASPGYTRAKLIIKLINSVADMVNKDPVASKYIKVVFIENYGVSLAEKIISAADVSEQISTAGKEASGTSNMKFMLNGAVTVGTLDGANVEMLEQVGEENIYIFGMTTKEVGEAKRLGTPSAQELYVANPEIKRVVDMLIDGTIVPENPTLFSDLYHSLLTMGGNAADEYMVIRDFQSYVRIQEQVGKDFQDKKLWAEKAICNTANAGYFSSDRAIREYSDKVWRLKPIAQPK